MSKHGSFFLLSEQKSQELRMCAAFRKPRFVIQASTFFNSLLPVTPGLVDLKSSSGFHRHCTHVLKLDTTNFNYCT